MSLVPQMSDVGISLDEEMEEVKPTLRTLDLRESQLNGYIDGLPAIEQAVLKILETERFKYLIYDWEYGIELVDLIGKEKNYIVADLKRRFEEAIVQYPYVLGILDFEIETVDTETIQVVFKIMTTHGELTIEKGVGIDEFKNI